jgi:lipopolysaccharide assembly LptE-like protein
MRRFGVRLALVVLLAQTACLYGFVGGGLPGHIDTVAVLPFDNDTPVSVIPQELHAQLRPGVESRLGLRSAAESRADAVVKGRIVRYDPDIPVAYSADPNQQVAARRRLEIAIDVEILDQTTGKTLFNRRGMVAQGDYDERQEVEGRRRAIEKLVREIVEGAQSQW